MPEPTITHQILRMSDCSVAGEAESWTDAQFAKRTLEAEEGERMFIRSAEEARPSDAELNTINRGEA